MNTWTIIIPPTLPIEKVKEEAVRDVGFPPIGLGTAEPKAEVAFIEKLENKCLADSLNVKKKLGRPKGSKNKVKDVNPL